MSKYISYDDLDYKNYKVIDKSQEFLDGVVYMAERIEEASSIEIVYCRECKHNADNGGLHDDGRTKCPIQEHYALPQDGFCHLGEKSRR